MVEDGPEQFPCPASHVLNRSSPFKLQVCGCTQKLRLKSLTFDLVTKRCQSVQNDMPLDMTLIMGTEEHGPHGQ